MIEVVRDPGGEKLPERNRAELGVQASPPEIGGQPGDYEERWAQWFLEQSFFRDFVYRNPRGKKKGMELADALVLFDDVAASNSCGRR